MNKGEFEVILSILLKYKFNKVFIFNFLEFCLYKYNLVIREDLLKLFVLLGVIGYVFSRNLDC